MGSSEWEPSTTIALVALVLAVPGAAAAIVTLWILMLRRRTTRSGMFSFIPHR
jgi:hypothetical protein